MVRHHVLARTVNGGRGRSPPRVPRRSAAASARKSYDTGILTRALDQLAAGALRAARAVGSVLHDDVRLAAATGRR